MKAFDDIRRGISALPELSDMYINMAKNMSDEEEINSALNEKAFKLSTKLLINIQKEDDNLQQSPSYSWLLFILELISKGSKNIILLQIAIEGILKICKKAIQNKQKFKVMYSQIKQINSIIIRLWNLLDYQDYITKTIELLVNFDELMPAQFAETIMETFLNKDTNSRLNAIQKFNTLWKLSAQKYKNYKILAKDNRCIFQMLEFLNDDEPRIRYSSKSWLLQSKEFLGRIIDPILEILILSTQGLVKVSEENELLYVSKYDATKVENNFKRLKNMLISDKIDFIGFSLKCSIHPYLEELFTKEESRQLYPFIHKSDPYINLFLFLALKYIFGRPLNTNENNISIEESEFQSSNYAARASAIEFLEQLLTNMEPKEIVPKTIRQIIDPLMSGFHNSLLHKELIIQSEILDLMKIILFNCNGDSQAYKENCIKIFCHELFRTIIYLGLTSSASFVKSSYINAAQNLIPLFYEVLKEEDRKSVCSDILNALLNQLSLCSTSNNLNKSSTHIRAENDILQIISGIQSFLHYGLLNKAIKEYVEYPSRYFLGLFEIKPETKRIEIDSLAEAMLNLLGELYISSLNIIEEDVDPLFVKDFNISRFGILLFTRDDYTEVIAKNNEKKQSLSKPLEASDNSNSQAKIDAKNEDHKGEESRELLSGSKTIFEKSFYDLLYPIIQKYPNEVLKAFIDVWINKISYSKTSMTKMIGTLISLKLSLLTFCKGLIYYLKLFDRSMRTSIYNKSMREFEYLPSKKEALIGLFAYQFIIRTHEDLESKCVTSELWKEILELLK